MSTQFDDDCPPTYQEALVQGILLRTGKTPCPGAPRLNPRSLDRTPSVDPASRTKPIPQGFNAVTVLNALVEEDIASPPLKQKVRIHTKTSGWQTDTSLLRSKTHSPGSKKKPILKSPAQSSVTTRPKDCWIQPLLAYSQSRPTLMMDVSRPLSRIKLSGDIPLPVRDSELDRLATVPPVAAMHIKCNSFLQYPVHVRNKSGVTYRDVLTAVHDVLHEKLGRQEWDAVRNPLRERVKLAFHRRCHSASDKDLAREKGLRRVDLLCDSVIWKGISSRTDDAGIWTLFLASR